MGALSVMGVYTLVFRRKEQSLTVLQFSCLKWYPAANFSRYIVSMASREDLPRWEFNLCGGRLKSGQGSWHVLPDPTSQSRKKNGIVRNQQSGTTWVNVSSSVQQSLTSLQFQLQNAQGREEGLAMEVEQLRLAKERIGVHRRKSWRKNSTNFDAEWNNGSLWSLWNMAMRWQMIILL